MICPSCGKENSGKFRYCLGCGEDMFQNDNKPEIERKEVSAPKSFHSPLHRSKQNALPEVPNNSVNPDDFFGKQKVRSFNSRLQDHMDTVGISDINPDSTGTQANESSSNSDFPFPERKRKTVMKGVGVDNLDMSALDQMQPKTKQFADNPVPRKSVADYEEDDLPNFIRARMKHKDDFPF